MLSGGLFFSFCLLKFLGKIFLQCFVSRKIILFLARIARKTGYFCSQFALIHFFAFICILDLTNVLLSNTIQCYTTINYTMNYIPDTIHIYNSRTIYSQ